MSLRDDGLRHQQSRWQRPAAHLWVRHDAARFFKPGTDEAEIFPARKTRPPDRSASFAASLRQDLAEIAALARELGSIKRLLQRRRLLAEECKGYREQPRLPKGTPEGGRWTHDPSAGVRTANPPPKGNLLPGDPAREAAASEQADRQVSDDLRRQLTQGQGAPSEEPPPIPVTKPKYSADRTAFMRAAASFLVRNAGLAANVFMVSMYNVDWLKERKDLIEADRDPALPMEVLQDGVGKKRPGYDDHHIVEQTWAEYFGFKRSRIDDPENLVSIPRLKHYQISGWYSHRNDDYEGLSPREYLRNKSWEERRKVGIDALIKFEVLKP
jgi:hypothetical protein